MEINNLEKFRDTMAGRTAIGTVITLSDPAVSELAADAGFDFTWIDAEHAPHTLESIMGHVMAVRGTNCAPLVRVPWNEPGIIKPILDLAPAGVIIPMVNTVKAAREAVAACKYPPQGIRGCGVRRGVRYGATPFKDYLKQSESDPMVIVQIEHIEAVKNLDAILKVPGIDSICVGPCDLSGSMGKLNQTDDPEVCRVINEICAKTKEAGLLLGTAGGPLPVWQQRGVNWIALTSDCGSMFAQSRQILEACR
jgi:2-keto-3-deoxy-L-rhamnonate aldolase RhmA